MTVISRIIGMVVALTFPKDGVVAISRCTKETQWSMAGCRKRSFGTSRECAHCHRNMLGEVQADFEEGYQKVVTLSDGSQKQADASKV